MKSCMSRTHSACWTTSNDTPRINQLLDSDDTQTVKQLGRFFR